MELGNRQRGGAAYYTALFLNAFITLSLGAMLHLAIAAQYTAQTRLNLSLLVLALFLLPLILLPRLATSLCQRFGALDTLRRGGWALLAITVIAALSHSQGSWPGAWLLTAAGAAQASLFATAKYTFLKPRVGVEHLSEANGYVSAVTATALLLASLNTSFAFELLHAEGAPLATEALQSLAPLSWLLVVCALLELGILHRLSATTPRAPDMTDASESLVAPRSLWQSHLRIGALGLAWLWAVGLALLLATPRYMEPFALPAGALVLPLPLLIGGIGVVAGAASAGRYSRRYLETGQLPYSAFILTLALALIPHFQHRLLLTALLFAAGFAGGMCCVPLQAGLQYFARDNERTKVIATSHAWQGLAMLAVLLLALAFAFLGWSSRSFLQVNAVLAIIGALWLIYSLPQSLTRFMMNRVVATRYRIQVQGLRHLPVEGGVLLLGNHASWIDWAVLQIACPRSVRFVLNSSVYDLWYLRWFFKRFGCIPIQAGAASRQALGQVTEALRRGEVVCLFPEGVISRNGNLGEFRRSYERACQEVDDDVVIVPFYLRGLWGSLYPHSADLPRQHGRMSLKREVVVDFGAPLPKSTPASELKRKVGELSNFSWREYADHLPSIGEHWIDTCTKSGNPIVLSDTMGTTLRSRTALTGSLILARRMRRMSREQNVGLLLPSSTGSVLGNLALMMVGKTVVNLNFTAPVDVMLSAVEQAEVSTIYTSSRFLDKLASRGVVLDALRERCRFVMLEELRASASVMERLSILAATWVLPASVLKLLFCKRISTLQPAVLLFSSGSEGHPKGVVLTHRNLLCNVKQFTELLNPQENDVMLANLPPFHAFGLTVTHLMPLLERMPVVCHADPTDVHGAALAIARHRITILLGTSSFLRLYVRNTKVHPLMLESLRLVVAGAEKLHDDVRREFREKFNKEIVEGYGATETAPVASVNMPDRLSLDNWRVQVGNKIGSVGLPLPGTSFRIVDPETYQPLPTGEAGMVLISGAQVMDGYLKNDEKTHSTLLALDGLTWYVTGDKGYLDEDGFLYIIDRYSRFAKVGGEMVGLGTVEHALRSVLNDDELELVVVNVPDEKKGEKLVVLSNRALDPTALREQLAAFGLTALAFPAHFLQVEAIPRLGSGKMDYAGAKRLALSLLNPHSNAAV